ncbi:sodium:proton antiporter [Leuconostocaceae bacterium ESL0958]|nr:sodium:proton antiporter [Leuconostocaceae bacterium ESL0958]
MDLIQLIIILVSAVACSSIISHLLPAVPISLFQIAIGLVLALSLQLNIEVDSHWFMMVFVAPILFNDSWRFPKRELWELRVPILGNAILLVLVTTVIGGFAIHLLIPKLSLAVSLALAAVLSPTDPVAVQAIAKRVKLPESVLHVVMGESLVNDATGLVSFNTAVKAAVAGTFVLTDALLNFAWMTMVGAMAGLAIAAAMMWLRDSVSRFGLSDVVFYTVLTLLMPFLIYWVAEIPLQASGLIAVVTGGIAAKLLNDRRVGFLSAEATIVSVHSWEVVVYVLNGLVFVLLGLTLPNALRNIWYNTQIPNWLVLLYGVLVWFIIFMLRVLWAYAIQWGQRWKHPQRQASLRTAIISGLSGVRGAVTLAAILTIPKRTASGGLFMGRDLVIFIAAIVIILSLLAASVMLPLVTKEKTERDFTQPVDPVAGDSPKQDKKAFLAESQARLWTVRVGMQQLRDLQTDQNRRIVHELITDRQKTARSLRRRLHENQDSADFLSEKEQDLKELALQAQRSRLRQLLSQEEIAPVTYTLQARRLKHIEADLASDRQFFSRFRGKWFLRKSWLSFQIWLSDQDSDRVREESDLAVREMAKAAIKALSDYVSQQVGDTVMHRTVRQAAYNLIVIYRYQIEKSKQVQSFDQQEKDDRLRLELDLKALNAERDFVQQLYEQKRISRKTSINLRQYINYAETRALVGRNEE